MIKFMLTLFHMLSLFPHFMGMGKFYKDGRLKSHKLEEILYVLGVVSSWCDHAKKAKRLADA